jgi:DNA-binding GntR family transcriptional regulator
MIFNWIYDVAAERPPLPARFHQDLVDAISQGDPEVADRAMRSHVRYGLSNILREIGQAGGRAAAPRVASKRAAKKTRTPAPRKRNTSGR